MNALTKKQYRKYDYLSRYSPFPVYYNKLDEKYLVGTTNQLNKNTSYLVHICKQNQTLDVLSVIYYKNPMYYWIIADFNSIQDPYEPLQQGRKIKIPVKSLIEYYKKVI